MRARWAATLAAALVFGLTSATGAASATPPTPLGDTYVLDEAGILSDADEADAQNRLTQLKDDTGLDMWVVFVDEFTSPSDAEEWANTTASDNNLGVTQYLLAVAVDTRQYYLSGDSAGPVSGDQLALIEQQRVQPALAAEDWTGAVDAAADGLTDAAGGGTGGIDSGSSSSGSGGWIFPTLLVLVIVGGLIFLFVWLARRRKAGAAVGGAGGVAPQITTAELARRAASSLIDTDDAIKTSTQELGFASAQFGEASTTEFEQAIALARRNLDEAFSLQQKLDDEAPDSEQDVRAWNSRIIALCDEANAALDEKAEAFDELRKLEQNAPEAHARVTKALAVVVSDLDAADSHLAALAATYAAEALATIADNPAQARARIAFAEEQLAHAQSAIAAGTSGEAAVGIRAAEEAVAQAAMLEQAIEKLTADLQQSEQRSAALISELENDIATAATLPDAGGEISRVIAATRQQIDAAKTSLGATGRRPIHAMQSLDAANQQIDGVVQGVRAAAEQQQRARQMLGDQILQARAQVSAAEDYITARRGAVGADARTRLAEAGASLARAQALQDGDPAQALQHAQRANQLAAQASQLAQADVGAFSTPGSGRGGSGGADMFGAVLGGIVINSLMSGGGRSGGGFGGMLGGGGGGRSRSGGGMRAGSFGGGGTRARRGGGRF